MQAHVLSVGQCTADDARIGRLLAVEADAHLDRAATADEARRLIAQKGYDLVLINRVLELNGQSGVELIGELHREGIGAPLMLVSDFREAQEGAVAQGALMGFGKASLGAAEVGQMLRQVLHSGAKAGQLR